MATKRKSDGSDGGVSKQLRSNYNATITVLVGPSEASFTVHKDLICRNSKFFEKACSGDWKEARERTVRLAGTNASFFQIYVEKLYFPTANLYDNTADALRPSAKPFLVMDRNEVLFQLCQIWALGDYLQDHGFQNAVVDTLAMNAAQEVPSGSTVEWVVGNTSTDSPLRKWLVNALIPYLTSAPLAAALLEELTGKLPADFLMLLLKLRVKSLPASVRGPAPLGDKCMYHVHPEGTAKCA
ncbi:hypothetical protein B0A55_10252 [Friedmanniomyces simplex]|uniref:BTB domain-containing protein n=1 Tax=Friedmanniomyces simplex TaxID=329884 RepID=A0A4U0WU60_9PEZI|nr:hypothetical protein B0A55_10252 [Friedmanniomyces simplex]